MFPRKKFRQKKESWPGPDLWLRATSRTDIVGYAEFKRDLLVRLPRLKLPGNGGLVRLATASVGDCDPKPAVLGNQRGQGEYAEDAPKLARRISPSRHIYRNAAIRTAQCLRRRVPDYFLKLRAAYPCFGHVHILHGDKGTE